MELRQIQCFAAAADLENFTSASERLHMSQSALSRQIGNLEAALGVSLFEREGRRVRLSPAGLRLKETADNLLKGFASLKSVVRAEASGVLSGHVTIAAPPSQGAVLFPRLARRAAVEHPGIKLHFIEARSSEAETSVLDGAADFALITHAEPRPDLSVVPLFSEVLYISYPSASPAELGLDCSLAEALAHPLIMPSSGRERDFIEQLAAKCGIQLDIAHDSNQHHLAIALSKNSQGCVLLPSSAVFDQKTDPLHKISRIRDLILTTYLVMRSENEASGASAEIERLLRKDIVALKTKGAFQ